jgi:hypothetical protein
MLGPILLTIIAVALLGFAVWLWPGRAPTSASTRAAPTHDKAAATGSDPKTEYLSRSDMFQSADQRVSPMSAPTEILMQPEPECTPPTEYLSREEILAPASPPKISHDRDTDDSLPTTMFSRDAIAANTKKPR